MSNCPAILRRLSKTCRGGHDHQRLVKGRAAQAAVYPNGLLDNICQGLLEEKSQSQLCETKENPLKTSANTNANTTSTHTAVNAMADGMVEVMLPSDMGERVGRVESDVVVQAVFPPEIFIHDAPEPVHRICSNDDGDCTDCDADDVSNLSMNVCHCIRIC